MLRKKSFRPLVVILKHFLVLLSQLVSFNIVQYCLQHYLESFCLSFFSILDAFVCLVYKTIISAKFLHCKANGFRVCGCKNSGSVKVTFFRDGPHNLIFLHCITKSMFRQFKSADNSRPLISSIDGKILNSSYILILFSNFLKCLYIHIF